MVEPALTTIATETSGLVSKVFGAVVEDWGIRANYSHRTGDNYRSGDGNRVSAGYESRELITSMGRDFGDQRSVEFSLLRLDQTDMNFPGYVFDIDDLKTDAYSLTYRDGNATFADQAETEFWYNRTAFNGNAQNPAKRAQFPLLDNLRYQGFTDVDSLSTGYRHGNQWGVKNDYHITIGNDLRFIKQELNEIANATTLGFRFRLPIAIRPSRIRLV